MTSSKSPLLLDAQNSQLTIIDIQTRLLPVMSGQKRLLKNCQILITAAKSLEIPVTVSEQYPKGIGSTDPSLVQALGELYQPVEKTCFSCINSPEYSKRIQKFPNRGQFILCGIEAHVCVLQTAMEMLHNHKQVFIVADAISSRNKNNKRLALRRLQQAGAIITCTESVIFEWLKDAKHAQFKTLSALIR